MSTFTPDLQLENPAIGAPGWGVTESTSRTLIDNYTAGIETLSVAGGSNVVLASAPGTSDQSRWSHFVFTGVLTGNIIVLFPNGLSRNFTVNNATTGGSFTLSVGVSNGLGGAAGTAIAVPRGLIVFLLSDGTNVASRFNTFVGGLTVDNLTVTGTLGLTSGLGVAAGGTGLVIVPTHNLLVGAGTSPLTPLAPGSAGSLLQSNGASADPTWTTLSFGTAAQANTGTSGHTLPYLDGTNTWSGPQTFSKPTVSTPVPLTVSGAVSVDVSQGDKYDLTVTGNITSFTITGWTVGQTIRMNLLYSGGSWTVAGVNANFRWPNQTLPTFSSTTGQRDKWVVDVSSSTLWDSSLTKNLGP